MVKQNVVIFTLLAFGALYILYPDIKKLFNSPRKTDPESFEPKNTQTRHLLSYEQLDRDIESNQGTLLIHDIQPIINKSEDIVKDFRSKKISRRRKRNAIDSNKFYKWNITLNVKRYDNDSENSANKVDLEAGKYLGLKVFAEGNGSAGSQLELHQALNSMEHFLKKLFGERLKDLKEDDISMQINSVPNQTAITDKNKEGRFFPGFFNFQGRQGNQADNSSTDQEIESGKSLTKVPEVSTVNTVEGFDANNPQIVSPAPIKIGSFISDDVLRTFCNNLLSSGRKSRLVNEFPDTGSGDFNTENASLAFDGELPSASLPTQTEKPSAPSQGWIDAILNMIRGNRSREKSRTTTEMVTIISNDDRNARKVETQDSFEHSEVSTQKGLGNMELDKSLDIEFEDNPNDVLTVAECERFFRSLPENAIFSEPNLLDVINNPSLLNQDISRMNSNVTVENEFHPSDDPIDSTESSLSPLESNTEVIKQDRISEHQLTEAVSLSSLKTSSIQESLNYKQTELTPKIGDPTEQSINEFILSDLETTTNTSFINILVTRSPYSTNDAHDLSTSWKPTEETVTQSIVSLITSSEESANQYSTKDSSQDDRRFWGDSGSGGRELDEFSVSSEDSIVITDMKQDLIDENDQESFPDSGSGNGRDFEESDNIAFTNSSEIQVNENDTRLLDTLFLPGSGGGEINLVQEETRTIVPHKRGARFDDVSTLWSTKDFKTSVVTIGIDRPAEVDNEGNEFSVASNSDNFEERLSPTTKVANFTTSTIFKNVHPKFPLTTAATLECKSASECNEHLNERCNTVDGRGVCECGRSFVRHPETRKCEVPIQVRTSLRLPGEVFHQDLMDRNTQRFQRKKREALKTMRLVLQKEPQLASQVANVDVQSFEEGSLIVNWVLVLVPVGNGSVSDLVQLVDKDLTEALNDQKLLLRAPLNVSNAVLLTVSSEVDPCERLELNYCSEFARCSRNERNGFRCQCKEGFLDISADRKHPGELCQEMCPKDYCGENGYCDWKLDGTKRCLCNDWYFGSTCRIPGKIAIMGFAAINVFVILLVVVCVCLCKRRRRRTQFYGQNQINFQPQDQNARFSFSPHVLDTLAMDELSPRASKYIAVSTPLNKPVTLPSVYITSPTVSEACSVGSADFDDSTFDRAPCSPDVAVVVDEKESK